MVLEYFTTEYLQNETPSRKDGIDFAAETKHTNTMIRMLNNAGKALKLPPWTIANASIDAQRFYAVKSMKANNRLLVMMAALFLAAKSDDCPRALQDVVAVCWQAWNKNKPAQEAAKLQNLKFLNELKELVIIAERSLLYARGFDMNVLHPYQELVKLLKQENLWKPTEEQVAREPKLEHVKQACWNLLNDSLGSTFYIQHTAKDIAKTALYLGLALLKLPLPVPVGKTFAEHFDIKQSILDDIRDQIMARYEKPSITLPEHTAGQSAGEHQQPAAAPAGAEPATEQQATAAAEAATATPATQAKAQDKVPAVRQKLEAAERKAPAVAQRTEQPESPEEGELPVRQEEAAVLMPHANGNGMCHKRKAESMMGLATSKMPKVELTC